MPARTVLLAIPALALIAINGAWVILVVGGTISTRFRDIPPVPQSIVQLMWSPAGHGAVGVNVTTSGGTSNETVVVFFVSTPVLLNLSPTRGPVAGGTIVTITGSDLSGATAVTFGGTPATTYTVNSNTQITATTPTRPAGPAPVVVTTPGDTSNALSFAYIAVPVITALTPDRGPTSGGNSVTITGSNLTFVNTVTFDGTPAAFTVLSDTNIAATAPPGTGTDQVSVTSPGGTSPGLTYTYVAAPEI